MLKGFKDFILRGNVVDLAVAVLIGAAFGAIVTAFSTDFLGGLIGAIGGTPNFDDAGFTINGSKVVYGTTITQLINFVIVAAVIYFVVVVPMKMVTERRKADAAEEAPVQTDEAILLKEIRDVLKSQQR